MPLPLKPCYRYSDWKNRLADQGGNCVVSVQDNKPQGTYRDATIIGWLPGLEAAMSIGHLAQASLSRFLPDFCDADYDEGRLFLTHTGQRSHLMTVAVSALEDFVGLALKTSKQSCPSACSKGLSVGAVPKDLHLLWKYVIQTLEVREAIYALSYFYLLKDK